MPFLFWSMGWPPNPPLTWQARAATYCGLCPWTHIVSYTQGSHRIKWRETRITHGNDGVAPLHVQSGAVPARLSRDPLWYPRSGKQLGGGNVGSVCLYLTFPPGLVHAEEPRLTQTRAPSYTHCLTTQLTSCSRPIRTATTSRRSLLLPAS